MTPLVYWMLFALAVIVWVAVPVCARLERRADERDRAAWRRMGGGRL
jgi:hypothetical protein